jgi:mannose-6-phosphate isomerase-like protein (cupin superfamily)
MIRKVHILAIAAWFPSLVTADGHSGPQLPDPLAAGWNGEKVCEQLHRDNDQRVLRCTFPPGVGYERHYHDKNFGYVLAGGRMRIADADGTRDVDLVAGNSYASDGTEWHEVVNIGDTTVVYLLVEPLSRH